MDTIDFTSQESSLRRFSQLKKTNRKLVMFKTPGYRRNIRLLVGYFMAEGETPVKTVQGCLFILLHEE